ncbi:MAG TPA: ribonuclease J [Candidatus Polarisedimenticolaceae bacterium]|nr:ribonuclease J [Candidatus Polarisedimenticolaceae bacterium]
MPVSNRLEIIPLGGLGEFGMNVMAYCHGHDCVVVDVGMMFPGADQPGVDLVLPDLSFLEDCGNLHGVVLTHGHEDHVGALPHLLSTHDLPVLATAHCRGLVGRRLVEYDPAFTRALRPLPPDGEPLVLGPFTIRTIRAAHSIPQSKMLVIDTPAGRVLHTADFKFDTRPPDGETTDVDALRRVGEQGVLALFADSTNADRPGTTPGEAEVARGLDRVIDGAPAKVVVSSFASNIQRVRVLSELAVKHGRRLALVGTSLETQVEVAERGGLIAFPPGVRISPERVMELPPREVLVLATGSQGEPLSALARIALDRHRHVAIDDDDLVIHSARRIPGNEKAIDRVFDRLLRLGADVITAQDAMIHASGHPSRGDLERLLELVRPRYLVPIHGEFRQLKAHHDLATRRGMGRDRVLLVESGDVIELDEQSIAVVDRVRVGQVCVDASRERIDPELLRDRRRSAGEGVVVAVVALEPDGLASAGFPQIETRGFVTGATENGFLGEARQVVVDSLRRADVREREDRVALKARIHSDLKRFLRRKLQRSPLIIPVVLER